MSMNITFRRAACVLLLVLNSAAWRPGHSSHVRAADEPAAESITLESPDQKIAIAFGLYDTAGKKAVPCYSVSYRGQELVHRATLGIDVAPAGPLGSDLRIIKIARGQRDKTYTIHPGKTSKGRDHYREAIVSLEERAEPRRRLDLVFRAYNDGIAFRYSFPQQPALRELTITAEHSTFAFTGNPRAYTLPVPSFQTHYEFYYRPTPALPRIDHLQRFEAGCNAFPCQRPTYCQSFASVIGCSNAPSGSGLALRSRK